MIEALINGKWEKVPEEQLTFGAETFAYASGLYETLRTLNYHPVFLEPHLDRLLNTARRIGLKITYSRDEIRYMLQEVINSFPDPDQRLRVLAVPHYLIIYTSALGLVPAIYEGVSVKSVQSKRPHPEIKTTDYSSCLKAWEKAQDVGCFEAILVDEKGDIYEGSRSNVFWVAGNNLMTRKTDVLPGVTRQTILSHALFPVTFGRLNQDHLTKVDELFITNSGSGIVPVSRVNGKVLGNGQPGKLTQELMQHYERWVQENVQAEIKLTDNRSIEKSSSLPGCDTNSRG